MLVGTVSVEASELVSRMLKREKIPHNVLNAKQHAREAQVVAEAGLTGAVTYHWTQIGNAIDRPEQLNFAKMTMWQGVYAPDISWHNGLFYILNTCVGCGGNFVITAKNPAGPWSDPVWIPIEGIDTSLFFDDEGTAWILNNGEPVGTPRYEGHRAIWLQQFDAKRLKPLGPRQVLVDSGVHPDRNPIWIEGPHILKKDGLYYLYAAEGGTAEGHSEVVFRSDRVTGPYLPAADNPILTQRDLPPDRKESVMPV